MKRKTFERSAAVAAAVTVVLGVSAATMAQSNTKDMITINLKSIASQAQQYYRTTGHSSFVGFSISSNDTGDVSGSYSIHQGASAPVSAVYVPGSTAPAGQAAAQTLYIVGCGKPKERTV